MKFIFTCLLSCLITVSFAQQSFRKSYGAPGYGEFTNGTIKLKDGTFIITGSTNHFGAGSYDAFCIHIDGNGKTLWSKTFGDSSYNASTKAAATKDGGFVMCFTSYKINNPPGIDFNGLFVVKCNKEGKVLWSKSIKSPSLVTGEVSITPYQVYESKAGDIYILSDWFSFNYNGNYSLTKLDAAGNLEWNNSVSLAFTFYRQFYLVQVTEAGNGNIIVGENLDADDFYTFDNEIHISLFSQKTGARILSRTIYQEYKDGYGNLRAYGLTVKNNTIIVSGTYGHDGLGYGDSWFALGLNDKEVTVFYDLYDNKYSRPSDSTAERFRQKCLAASRTNTTADGGYIYAYDSYDPDYNIIIEKTDSLGRTCTDTAISYPSSTHIQRTICQVYSDRDYLSPYVFTAADTTLTITDVTAEKTLCETFATPLVAAAGKSTNTIENTAANTGLQLYPNPATDRVVITFQSTQPSTVQADVITMQGQTVLTQKAGVGTGKQQVILNVKSLSPGMYYIKLSGLAQSAIMKFVKQ